MLDAGGFAATVQRVVVQGPLANVDAVLPDGRRIEICAARADAAQFNGEIKLSARRTHVFAA